MENQDEAWTLARIREHVAEGLPLAALFNIDVIEATAERGAVRLRAGEHATRPGGSIAGPVQFALADLAAYALILADRRDIHAVTVDLTINFLRPAMHLPLVAVALPLRAGRRLYTAEIRISEEATGRLVSHASTTYAMSRQQ
jgi:uncharacterized protein (TIGR00369 family)